MSAAIYTHVTPRIQTTTMYAHMASPKRLAELTKFLE
jgi:hypothetical protein